MAEIFVASVILMVSGLSVSTVGQYRDMNRTFWIGIIAGAIGLFSLVVIIALLAAQGIKGA